MEKINKHQQQQQQQQQQQRQQQQQQGQKQRQQNQAVVFNFARDIEQGQHVCRYCSKMFVEAAVRDQHEKAHRQVKSYSCRHCRKNGFKKIQNKRLHERSCQGSGITQDRYLFFS